MFKVNFNIKDKNSKTTSPLNLIFIYNKQRLKYAIGKSIRPAFWDSKKQRAKPTPKFPFSTEFNQELNEWEQKVSVTFKRYIEVEKRYPFLEELRGELDVYKSVKLPQHITIPTKVTLFDFFETFIKEKSIKIIDKNNTYMFVYGHLKDYLKANKKKTLDFNDITMDFFRDFVYSYLYDVKEFKTNYASKLIAAFKTVLKEALNRGISTNTIHTNRNFHISEVEVDNIYLTGEELHKIYQFDLSSPENERLEKVRDLFIIGCYTGLRFVDFSTLKPEHFSIVNGKEIISITTQKTKNKVKIPASKFVKEILKKYNGIPKAISNQKMNDYLKELGEFIGFDEAVIRTEYKAGKRLEITYKKFELISTHTARRSFATNAFLAGIEPYNIMQITGHSSDRQFFKYIKIKGEANALLMAEHSFFN